MRILQILPLKKQAFSEELTYFSKENIEVGDIVEITIKSKKILGLVIDSNDILEMKSQIKNMNFNLKKVAHKKEHSIFRKEFIEAVFDTSKYFILNKNYLLSFLIPSIIKENYDTIAKDLDKEEEIKKENIIKSEKLLFQNNTEDRIDYYKTYIRQAFAKRESVFITLPTEQNIEFFQENLNKGIENFVYILHNNLNKKTLLKNILEITQTRHPVLIIGTPNFLCLPINNLKTIILEQENSTSYKTFQKPIFDMRIFTEIFASKINAKFIMSDNLLRFETIERENLENLSSVGPMSFRTNWDGEINIFDKNKKIKVLDREEKKFEILTEETIEEIKKTLQNKGKIFVFALRKGLATYTICNDCKTEVSCDECKSPLILYQKTKDKKIFICNKCKTEKDTLSLCNNCNSWNLVPLGIGIDKIKEELQKHFKGIKIYQFDKNNIKNKKEIKEVLKNFENTENSILLGTEMSFFYLKEKVDLSLIASFDSLFTIPNFKINEKILNILLRTINITKEKLIIETKNPENEVLVALKNKNLANYIREELEDRKVLKYPPFERFIKITYLGNNEENLKIKKFIEENFHEYNPIIFKSNHAINQNKYNINILIKLNPKNWAINDLLSNANIDENLYNKLSELQEKMQIQIDPEDLL